MWVASAFKGATGEKQYIPDILSHVRNQMSWLRIMEREAKQEVSPVNFRGLVLTGWSRYDHFAVLCELLPVALPSLVINLMVVSLGSLQFPVSRKIHKLLDCDNIKMLISMEELKRNPYQWDLTRCGFPGVKVYSLISNFNLHKTEVEKLHHAVTDSSAWMSSWNVKHQFSSSWRIKEILKTSIYLPSAVRELEIQAKRVLPLFIGWLKVKTYSNLLMIAILDNSSTTEWIEQNIEPLSEKLKTVAQYEKSLSGRDVWPRGPA